MKVLLVSANTVNSPHPVYPLGLDYVAGALAPRHEVRILDMNGPDGRGRLAASLKEEEPDLVGISIRNIDNVDACAVKNFVPEYEQIVRIIRGGTGAPIVLGGSGFSIFPGELMTLLGADFGIVGEGEALGDLLSTLARGADPATIPGVLVRGAPARNLVSRTAGAMRRLLPAEHHRRPYLTRGGILNLQTKRGCPFGCIYCTYPHLEGRRFRLFPPEGVAREARELQEMGARFLFITDSTFNADEGHSLSVAQAFRRQGVTIPWGAFLAPTSPSDGYYATLAEAGFTHAEFGTEALCDSQLKRYRKPFTVGDSLAAHGSARAAGLFIAHYLLLGGPGEDGGTVDATLGRMEELEGAAFFVFCGIRIFPHTPLFDLAVKEGQIRPDQDLLAPVFYRSQGIGKEEIMERVKRQARGRVNWVCGDGAGETERIVSRMHARGRTGPLWELLLR